MSHAGVNTEAHAVVSVTLPRPEMQAGDARGGVWPAKAKLCATRNRVAAAGLTTPCQ